MTYANGASGNLSSISVGATNVLTLDLPGGLADTGLLAFEYDSTGSPDDFTLNSATINTFGALGSADLDADGDGIFDNLDLDSDNDGITDNIEAQTTAGYIAPSGTGNTITDVNNDGLDDSYDTRTVTTTTAAATAAAGGGLTPVNTDGDALADYIDTDSDNEGGSDAAESGIGATTVATGLSTAATDADGDGLFDVFEGGNANDGFIVNDEITPLDGTLIDTDGDVILDTPLTEDLDFRDGRDDTIEGFDPNPTGDNDGDGIINADDIDDDNDGILDVDEGLQSVPVTAPLSTYTTTATTTTSTANVPTPTTGFAVTDTTVGGRLGFTAVSPGESGNGAGTGTISEIFVDVDLAAQEFLSDPTLTASVAGGFDDGLIIQVNGVTLVDFNQSHYLNNAAFLAEFDVDNSGRWTPWINEGNPQVEVDLLNGTIQITALATDGTRKNILDFLPGTTQPNPFPTIDLEVGISFGMGYSNSPPTSGGDPAAGSIGAITVTFDSGALGIVTNRDTDGDGIYDHLDLDSDNDGISDLYESGSAAGIAADTNNDGHVSDTEAAAANGGTADNDDDGLQDIFDADVNNVDSAASAGTTARNTDGDALADHLDLDSDNDGIADTIEGRTTNPFTGFATNDGDVSNDDGDSDGIVTLTGAGDFEHDGTNTYGGTFAAVVDTDNDGIDDYRDTDSDGDGILDIVESGLAAVSDATYADPDGSAIGVGNLPIDVLTNVDSDATDVDFRSVQDTDGDGVGDFEDIDDDNDGILDIVEDGGNFNSIVDDGGTIPILDSQNYSATGAGAAGVPTIAYTVPEGNDRLIIVSITVERDHTTGGPGSNWETDAFYGGTGPSIDFGGNVFAQGLRADTQQLVGAPNTSAEMSTATYFYLIGEGSIPTGTGPQTLDLSAFRLPQNAGDEFIVNITTYANVDSVELGNGAGSATADSDPITNSVTITGTAESGATQPAGTTAADNRLVTVATTGSNEGTNLSAGWTRVTEALVENNNGQFEGASPNFTGDTSENDGASLLVQTLTGVTGTQGDPLTTVEANVHGQAAFMFNLIAAGPADFDTDGDGIRNSLDLDSDNDGISDLEESGNVAGIAADANNDGHVSDAEALAAIPAGADQDNDGLQDVFDADTGDTSSAASQGTTARQTDADGVADYQDLDSDGDGIADAIEARATNAQIPLATLANGAAADAADSDNDGVLDVFEGTSGTHGGDFGTPNDDDADGTADYISTDSDGDGLLDSAESGLSGILPADVTYLDADGTIDVDPATTAGLSNDGDNQTSDLDFRSFQDTDGDGVGDFEDIDDDNDGILDTEEGFVEPGTLINATNYGMDGTPGAATAATGWSIFSSSPDINMPTSTATDLNTSVGFDWDFTLGATSIPESDHGGNFQSMFSSEGVSRNVSGLTPGVEYTVSAEVMFTAINNNGNVFANNVGVEVYFNGVLLGTLVDPAANLFEWNTETLNFIPTTTGGQLTLRVAGGNGYMAIDNVIIGEAAAAAGGRDTDGDGIFDHLDLDSDNDGISDLEESGSGGTDSNNDGVLDEMATTALQMANDLDDDGLLDSLDNGNEVMPRQTADGDGIADYLDLDSDGDRIADAIEARPTSDGNVITSNLDSDGDGVIDHFDTTNDGTFGGNFTAPVDTDTLIGNNGDGVADYIDLDSDGDGLTDANESGLNVFADTNGDGIGDDPSFNISYADADGTLVPSTSLDNFAGNTTEVAYRELNVPPVVDLNDDTTTAGRDNTVSYIPGGTAVDVVEATGGAFDTDSAAIRQLVLEFDEASFADGTDEVLTIGGVDFEIDPASANYIDNFQIDVPITVNGNDYIVRVAASTTTDTLTFSIIETNTLNDGDGLIPLADAQALLQGITYRNDAGTGVTVGDRTFTVQAIADQSGIAASNVATATITVSDPAPIIDLNDDNTTADLDRSLTFTESNSAIAVAAPTAEAIDGADNINELEIVVAGATDGNAEVVNILGEDFELGTDEDFTFVNPAGDDILVSFAGGTFTISNATTPGDPIPAGDLTDLIQGITYNHSSDNPTAGNRTLTFSATDTAGNTSVTDAVATITVVPVNDPPVAEDDSFTASEDASAVTGSVLSDNSNGADSDPENDTLMVSMVDGDAANVGTAVAGSTGGLFTINADGSVTFDSNGDFEDLDDGEMRTTVITYEISDGNGGTDTAAVSVIVQGANDAPNLVAGIAVPTQNGTDSTPLTALDTSGLFEDVDVETLTFSSPDIPSWMMIDSATGIITGTPPADASQGGPLMDGVYTVTVTATDPDGESVSTTVTYSLMNPPPVVDVATPDEAAVDGETVSITPDFSDPDGDTLSYTVTGLPNGLSINSVTGEITGTLDADASQVSGGVYTITVIADDGEGGTVTDTFDLTVTNPAPVAVDDTGIAPEDGTSTGNVMIASDSDPDEDTISVSMVDGSAANVGMAVAGANGGLFTINMDGSYTFDANGDFEGLDAGETDTTTITYEISDGEGGTDAATVTITVQGANDAPIVTGTLAGQVGQDGVAQVPFDASTVFSDVDVEILTYSSPDLPSWMSISATGEITGTPPADASQGGVASDGVYTVTVVGTDPEGENVSTTVTYTFTNPPPVVDVATPDTDAVDGETVSIPTDFSDPDGDTLSYTATGLPTGLMIDSVTGEITGTLDPDASQGGTGGVYTITVTADDGEGGTVTDTFDLTVTNPAPDAVDDALTANENQTINANVITGSDSDPDGDALTVSQVNGDAANVGTAVAGSTGGQFTLNSDGSLTFDPGTDFEGLDLGETATSTITYQISDGEGGTDTATVTVTIEGGNDAPTVTGTLTGQTGEDSTAQVPFDASTVFSDVDGETLTYSSADLPPWMMIDSASGEITGTPPADASQGGAANDGVYVVTVTATDPDGEDVSTTVTYTFTNPPPVVDVATSDVAAIDGETVSIPTDFSDPDGDTLSYTAAGLPTGLMIDPATGEITGTIDPAASQVNGGVYTVTVTADDGEGGTVTDTFDITVTNQAPEVDTPVGPQTAEDNSVVSIPTAISDPEGDDLTYTVTGLPTGLMIDSDTGEITGTVDPSASQGGPLGDGVYTVVVTADDGEGGTVTDTFIFTATNPAPVVDTPIGNQTANDADVVSITPSISDPDGDTLTYSVTGLPIGLNIIPSTGEIVGTIDPSASQGAPLGDGVYTVVVTADDGEGGSVTDTFTYTISNLAPDAVDDSANANEGAPITGFVILGSDSDPDQDVLSVSQVNGDSANVGIAVTGTNGGEFTINPDGTFTFDPNGDFEMLDVGETATTTITYEVSDGEGGTDTATVTITVNGTNDAPITTGTLVAQTGTDSVAQVPFDASTVFSDIDAEPLTYSSANLPSWMSIDSATGEIIGTPPSDASQGGANSDGVYVITITATDPDGESVDANVVYTFENVAPVAQNDVFTTAEDTPLFVNVIPASDSDPDGDTLVIDMAALPDGTLLPIGTPTVLPEGTLTINSDGSVEYDPADDFNGPFTFGYTLSDGEGGTDVATVTINVTDVNDAPEIDLNGPDTGVDEAIIVANDDPSTPIIPDTLIADVDSLTLTSLTGTIGGNADGAGEAFTLGGEDLAIGTGGRTFDITQGGTTFTVVSDGTSFTATVSGGTGDVADVNALTATLSYEHTQNPPTLGNRTVTLSVADDLGLTSNDAIVTIRVVADTTPPVAPEVDPPVQEPEGELTVTGTGEPGSTVKVLFADGTIGTAEIAADGSWSVSSDTVQTSGDIVVTVCDDTENESPPVTQTFVDDNPPLPPTLDEPEQNPDGTLTVTGEGEPGATIKLTFPNGETGTALVAADGSWTLTSTTVQSSGDVVATQCDEVGNESPPAEEDFVDDNPPLPPSVEPPVQGPEGELTVTGTGEPGSTIKVTFANGETGEALVAADGTWTLTSTSVQTTGGVVATSCDPDGNESPPTTTPFVDDNPPLPPEINEPEQTPEGYLVVTGTGEPGATIKLTFPNGETGTALVAADGTWTLTSTTVQSSGDVVATQCDEVGNESPPSEEDFVDDNPPLPPTIVPPVQGPEGELTVTGTGEPGATIKVTFANGETGTALVAADGTWTLTSTTVQTTGDVVVSQCDEVGNESPPVTENFVDDNPPLPPTIEAEHNNETGLVDVTGTGEPGATITLTFPNGETVEVIVDPNGNYTASSLTPQPDGDVIATQADEAGNVSEPADDDYSNLDIIFVDMGDNGQGSGSDNGPGNDNGVGDSLSDKGEGGFVLHRYFRDMFGRTDHDDFERSLDKERKTGVNVEVPRLGDGTDHLIVATVAFEHNINVQLTSDLVGAANVKTWSVTSVDGRPLPSWVEYVPGSDFFEMLRPLDQDSVKLRIKAVLDNGRTVSKVVEIDMRTGVVEDEGGTFNQAQTLSDQLNLETQRFASENDELIKSLAS